MINKQIYNHHKLLQNILDEKCLALKPIKVLIKKLLFNISLL